MSCQTVGESDIVSLVSLRYAVGAAILTGSGLHRLDVIVRYVVQDPGPVRVPVRLRGRVPV